MRRRHRMALAVLLTVLISSSTAAQDRLVIGQTEVGAIGHFAQPLGRIDAYLHGGLFAGGRAVVAGPDRVRDLRTGIERVVPGTIAAVDPGRPRVFLLPLFSGVRAVDVATGETRTVWDGPWLQVRMRYAPSADRLVLHVVRPGAVPLTTSLVVVDASTGTTIHTHDGVLPFDITAFMVSDDGERVFAGVPSGLIAVNTATGVVTGAVPVSPSSAVWDPVHDRLLLFGVHLQTSQRMLIGLDRDLGVVGAAAVADACGTIRASAHTGRIYFYGNMLRAFSAAGQLLNDQPVVVAGRTVTCDEMTLLTAPGPPRGLAASVSAHAVSLAWSNIGGASGFVVDVGLAPGRTDLAIFVGNTTTVAFAGVPSGTYFVRVRGGNEFGGGRPSAEIQVVVS